MESRITSFITRLEVPGGKAVRVGPMDGARGFVALAIVGEAAAASNANGSKKLCRYFGTLLWELRFGPFGTPPLVIESSHPCDLELTSGLAARLHRRQRARLRRVHSAIPSSDRMHRDAVRPPLPRDHTRTHRPPRPGDAAQNLRQPVPDSERIRATVAECHLRICEGGGLQRHP